MKKRKLTPQEEMIALRDRMDNLETKLKLINEPMLVDALAYELLALKARMSFLIADTKNREQVH